MDTDHAGSPPNQILGYTIRSRTRIYVSYLIPSALVVCVYIVQIVADCAVSYEHFRNHQAAFGGATLSLIFIPPILTFILILSSKKHRENPRYTSSLHFFGYHVLQLLLFPFFTIYRSGLRIFWSAEALFHDDDDVERMLCLKKATECDTCELYQFIQAYAQAAPQIILQLYHMLTQDLFRDFQTTTAQGICLVFSAIDLAGITTSYHRFESQHRVGRAFPWAAPQQLKAQEQILECNARLRKECEKRKRDSERTLTRFPQSEKIMENFNTQNSEMNKNERGFDEVDDDLADVHETTVLIHSETMPEKSMAASSSNATDDDKILIRPKLHFDDENSRMDNIISLDTVPDSPPPPLPASFNRQQSQTPSMQNKRASKAFSQLEAFKDMFIVNAQLYIKEHVPHPPKILIQRVEDSNITSDKKPEHSPLVPTQDEIDFFLPRPTRIVNGIQQEDFAAKSIAFFGWIAYILMRMLALATFSCFYPKAFFILIGVHYIIMLIWLCLESRFWGALSPALFYLVLAYVYIFVLLEFRIQFKKIRLWYVGYFLITMSENIVMTIVWNANENWESWWFGFITETIIYSGILFIVTLIVYYWLLKPKEITFIVEDNSVNN